MFSFNITNTAFILFAFIIGFIAVLYLLHRETFGQFSVKEKSKKRYRTSVKKYIKNVLGITALEKENEILVILLTRHRQFVNNKMAELKEYTRVDADVGVRGSNTIILTGVYKNQGFVKFYDFDDRHFSELVEQLNDMRKHCLIRNIDKPPSFHPNLFNIKNKE